MRIEKSWSVSPKIISRKNLTGIRNCLASGLLWCSNSPSGIYFVTIESGMLKKWMIMNISKHFKAIVFYRCPHTSLLGAYRFRTLWFLSYLFMQYVSKRQNSVMYWFAFFRWSPLSCRDKMLFSGGTLTTSLITSSCVRAVWVYCPDGGMRDIIRARLHPLIRQSMPEYHIDFALI